MEYLLLAVLVILYTLQSLLTKLYTDKYPGDENNASAVLTSVSGLTVVFVTFFFFSYFEFTFNIWSILIGMINAVALFAYNYFIVGASRKGPYSILMMFSLSFGIILPIIAALIMGWDAWETPGEIIVNLVSIIAIIAAVYLVSVKDAPADAAPEEKKAPIGLVFFLFCFGLGLCNGIYGICLTLQQQTAAAGGEGNRDEMIIMTFLVAAIISLSTLIFKEKRSFIKAFRQNKMSALYLAGTSIVFALAINVIVIIIPMIPTTILYTFDNSAVLILSVLASCVFFKEKLSAKNIIGISIMVAALVSMNLIPTLL